MRVGQACDLIAPPCVRPHLATKAMVRNELLSVDELKIFPHGWKQALSDVISICNDLSKKKEKEKKDKKSQGRYLGNLVASSSTTEKPSRARTAAE